MSKTLLDWRLLAVLFSAVVLAGCGAGEYRKRMEETARRGAMPLSAPAKITENVWICIPTTFTEQARNIGDKRRLNPSNVDLPGWAYTYEVLVTTPSGGKQPYYCALGAQKAAQGAQEAVQTTLQGQMKLAGLNPGTWESVSLGGKNWQRLRGSGKLEFLVDATGAGTFNVLPGTLDVYLCKEADYLVTMAWWMPDELRFSASGMPEAMGATVEVK